VEVSRTAGGLRCGVAAASETGGSGGPGTGMDLDPHLVPTRRAADQRKFAHGRRWSMWEFDEAVEVHTVAVDGLETPDQFLWRGRLWRVNAIQSHWTETAAWWERGIIGPSPLTYEGHPAHWTPTETARPQADSHRAPADTVRPQADSHRAYADAPRVRTAGVTRTHSKTSVPSTAPRSLGDCLAALASAGTAAALAPGSAAALEPIGATTALAPTGTATAEVRTDLDCGEPVGRRSASPAAVGVLDAEWGPRRTVFRAEAGCGRHGRQELFDLAYDPDSGRWQLERVTNR
jgi:hypothetical protein